ncbi:hypothetical protein DSCA_00410 [Desulfosarcina alkanivorans]|uniref:Coiled coil domain-containing protein n=1 Tax=Desulfosarcina alkanivorans TaxID=571177 RepID=A0A5K7YHD5_9BACT|nr:hypothetical protein [Desulfosarcina alkanivorans]BBO66111.1 hypothetical protein DSCA_00410 [Desulfosarcina alkanivorans]
MPKREIFVEKFKAKLDGWSAELDRLESKSDAIDFKNRARYRATIQEVKGQIQQLDKKLMVLKNTTTDAWQDLKKRTELAWNEFESGGKEALKKVTGNNY